MSKQTTLFDVPTKITFQEFSAILLETGDIDPDYIFLRERSKALGFSKEQIFDWILHKLCIYNSISELKVILGQETFETCKYGNERNKHKNQARGYYKNITEAFCTDDFDPQYIEEAFTLPGQIVFDGIKSIRGFGPWSAWKFMDLMSCVYGVDVDFEGIDFRKSYEFPLKGLLMVNHLPEDLKLLKDDETYNKCIEYVKILLEPLPVIVKGIPHNGNKGIRINEIETLLCKYHSYVHGHYSPGKDLAHLQKAIEEYDS